MKFVLINYLQVRTTKPTSPTLWLPISARLWGVCLEEICYRNRGAGFPSEMVQVHLPKFQAKDDWNFNSYNCPYGIFTHCSPREQNFPVKSFKFIYPSSKPRMTETSTCIPVHVAYSPLTSMNHQWTININDRYTSSNALRPVEYIPPSIPTLCNLMSTMFHFHVDFLHSTQDTQHDLSSLASPKGEMTSTFSWTSFVKSPTPSTLCFGDPTLAKINQVFSVSMCETVLSATKSATNPPNTKTSACMYLQEEPSTPPSDESRDTDAHHTYRSQCNHELTGLDVVAYLERDLPTTLHDQ